MNPSDAIRHLQVALLLAFQEGEFKDVETCRKFLDRIFAESKIDNVYQNMLKHPDPNFSFEGFGKIYENQILDICLVCAITITLEMHQHLKVEEFFKNFICERIIPIILN